LSLRAVLGRFVTGVTVVTAATPDGPVGITANSFTSVSLDPALVLFCIHHGSRVRTGFTGAGSFVVNILAEHQEPLSRKFAGPVEHRSEGVRFHYGRTGAPILADAMAYLDCDLYQQFDAGDHVIVLGQVRDHRVQRLGHRPLTVYRGRYGTVG
jgi:flavin reductase (DIM6/NTAB) family NADH-FMN oxidoreductase RutF